MTRQFTLTLVAALLVNVSPICRAAYAAQGEPEVVDGVAGRVCGRAAICGAGDRAGHTSKRRLDRPDSGNQQFRPGQHAFERECDSRLP